MTRQTLSNIHQDDERQSWYLDGTADDDRVDAALEATADAIDDADIDPGEERWDPPGASVVDPDGEK